jgi:hypothetical protein
LPHSNQFSLGLEALLGHRNTAMKGKFGTKRDVLGRHLIPAHSSRLSRRPDGITRRPGHPPAQLLHG